MNLKHSLRQIETDTGNIPRARAALSEMVVHYSMTLLGVGMTVATEVAAGIAGIAGFLLASAQAQVAYIFAPSSLLACFTQSRNCSSSKGLSS